MPVNQPPISDDAVMSSWQYEITELVNESERQIVGRVLSGPFSARPTSAALGTEYYDTTNNRWYKYGTTSWIQIGG